MTIWKDSVFSKSFVDTMPQWLKEQFFDPKMVKQRLNTHEYQQSENAQQLRCLENLYLVEFKELSLKNYKGFEEGIKFFTESKLNNYLSKFHVIFPGDHPMQYFCRQIVYANSYCRQNFLSRALNHKMCLKIPQTRTAHYCKKI